MHGVRIFIENYRINKAVFSSQLSKMHNRVPRFAQPKSSARAVKKELEQTLFGGSIYQIPPPLFTPQTLCLAKSMHTSGSNRKEINYSEYLNLRKRGLTVVDVREASEIKASGTIPGSLNIPLKQVNYALSKSADDFKAKYGKSKPSENDHLLFLCQKGGRSRSAMEKAMQLGYNKALSYRGGWEDFYKNANK